MSTYYYNLNKYELARVKYMKNNKASDATYLLIITRN